MGTRAICRDCYREVLWTVTDAGKRLAVDPEPDETGNTAAYRDGTGTFRSRRPTDELPIMAWEKLYVPHVATCTARQRRATQKRPAVLPPGVLDLTAYRRRAGGRS
ncbi:hypothetical protein VSR01_17495 [Actinacidiphila sp. DG2A-62]|uniref:hypothetical protein n=1 Tax=Actinacidiphila sp. DG2A-62 TaxID=3108821 RepID=UPI002DB6CBE1|nr:hypothetical protein [Actinacidiphila sp. DG2A-62]MEC3995234.1 hypothetical protein [Actinacidiphila sp. DG2A-62]